MLRAVLLACCLRCREGKILLPRTTAPTATYRPPPHTLPLRVDEGRNREHVHSTRLPTHPPDSIADGSPQAPGPHPLHPSDPRRSTRCAPGWRPPGSGPDNARLQIGVLAAGTRRRHPPGGRSGEPRPACAHPAGCVAARQRTSSSRMGSPPAELGAWRPAQRTGKPSWRHTTAAPCVQAHRTRCLRPRNTSTTPRLRGSAEARQAPGALGAFEGSDRWAGRLAAPLPRTAPRAAGWAV